MNVCGVHLKNTRGKLNIITKSMLRCALSIEKYGICIAYCFYFISYGVLISCVMVKTNRGILKALWIATVDNIKSTVENKIVSCVNKADRHENNECGGNKKYL
jgi:hypothetical protein